METFETAEELLLAFKGIAFVKVRVCAAFERGVRPVCARRGCALIRTRSGWLYLAAVLDLHSRKIVGWAMANAMPAALVCAAL